jgi:hypothetical protein
MERRGGGEGGRPTDRPKAASVAGTDQFQSSDGLDACLTESLALHASNSPCMHDGIGGGDVQYWTLVCPSRGVVAE